MTCTYRFTRGKHVGELCPKRTSETETMCVPHARIVFENEQRRLVPKCLCGQVLPETDDWCDMITHHTDMCHECSVKNTVVTCHECGKAGLPKLVARHFEETHCTIAVNNTSLSVKKRRAFRPSSVVVTSTCQICEYTTTSEDDMLNHGISNHMKTVSVRVSPPFAIRLCPVHGDAFMLGEFCRMCMTRSENNVGWNCMICSETHVSPPEPHFLTHMITDPPMRTKLTYTCSHTTTCDAFDHDPWYWIIHFKSHLTYDTQCPFPDCTTILDYNQNRLEWHFTDNHFLTYTHKGETSKYLCHFKIHNTAYIRNALVDVLFPPGGVQPRFCYQSILPLQHVAYSTQQVRRCCYMDQFATWAIAMKCVLPKTIVWSDNITSYHAMIVLRDILIEHCESVTANRSCDYMSNTLPFELWDIVYKQLGCKDRLALRNTCTYLQQIHKALYGNVDHMITFIKNNYKMLPRDCYGYISVTRARSDYMLSLKDLKNVPLINRKKEYTTANIAKALCTKYGTIEKFLEEKTRRKTRRQKTFSQLTNYSESALQYVASVLGSGGLGWRHTCTCSCRIRV